MIADTTAATGRKLALLLEQAEDEGVPAERLVAMLEGAVDRIQRERVQRQCRERREDQR